MSVQDTLEFDPGRAAPRGQADTTVPPGIFDFNWDATKAAAADAAADVPGRGYERRQGEIAHVAADFARQTGLRPDAYYIHIPGEPVGNVPLVDEERLFRDIRRYREAGNPDAFKDIGNDVGDFDKRLRERFRAEDASREQRMSKGGLIGNLAGGIAGAFTDPVNILTLPIGGGGKTAVTQIIRNGVLNAGIEAGETPLFIAERDYQGREWTGGEMATNIALAGLGGAAFDAVGKGIARLPALDAKLYDAAAPVRAKVDARFTEADMVRAFRQMVPENAMTPDQAAAVHVWTRGEEVRASNPFQQTYEAIEAHEAMLDSIVRDFDAGQALPLPVAPARSPMPASGLAPDFENAWAAIIGIEGGTNRDGSFRTSPAGAIGPAQVMPGTAPEAARLAGLPFDEARYRSDADYNIALGRAYYREMLRQFDGDPVKAAAAYNAGPGSASRGTGVRGAMARARRAGVPDDWVSFLPAETRGYVANFQQRTGMAPGGAIDAGEAGALPRDPALDAERPLVTDIPPDPLEVRPEVMREGIADAVRAIVADRGRSLNQVPRLADELGVSEGQLREAMDVLVGNGELRQTKSGIYRRAAQAANRGPDDMLRFIVRNGGLAYDGLDEGGRRLGTAGHDLRNSGNLDKFVPGAGPLLRPGGRGLDAMAELLHDAGYFGPPETTPRPSETELITTLDDVIRRGEKRYSSFDDAPAENVQGERRRDGFQSEEHYEAERTRWNAAAQQALGRDLDEDEFFEALDVLREGGLRSDIRPDWQVFPDQAGYDRGDDLAPYITAMVNRRIDDALEDAYLEVEDRIYDPFDETDTDIAAEAGSAADGGERSAADAGDAGAGSEGAAARPGDASPDELTPAERDALVAEGLIETPPLDEATARLFDDPHSAEMRRMADGVWHDILNEEAQLRAAAPLRGENVTGQAQDGTMGLGLFDAADQPMFDLEDGLGERSIAEIRAELDKDAADIDAIEACMRPGGTGGAA